MRRLSVLLTLLLVLAPALAAQPAADSALVAGIYDDLARGDVEAVVAVLDVHVLWSEGAHSPQAGRHFGPGTVAAHVLHPQATAGITHVPDAITSDRAYLVAVGTTHRTEPAADRSLVTRFHHVWQVLDGRVVSVQRCDDTTGRSASARMTQASC